MKARAHRHGARAGRVVQYRHPRARGEDLQRRLRAQVRVPSLGGQTARESVSEFTSDGSFRVSRGTHALVAVHHAFQQEGRRLPVVLAHEAAVRQHGREVVGEEAGHEGHQVGAASHRRRKGGEARRVAAGRRRLGRGRGGRCFRDGGDRAAAAAAVSPPPPSCSRLRARQQRAHSRDEVTKCSTFFFFFFCSAKFFFALVPPLGRSRSRQLASTRAAVVLRKMLVTSRAARVTALPPPLHRRSERMRDKWKFPPAPPADHRRRASFFDGLLTTKPTPRGSLGFAARCCGRLAARRSCSDVAGVAAVWLVHRRCSQN